MASGTRARKYIQKYEQTYNEEGLEQSKLRTVPKIM